MQVLKSMVRKSYSYPEKSATLSRAIRGLERGSKVFVAVRIGTFSASIESIPSSTMFPSVISPWLMIPPRGGGFPKGSYWFYSLAEQAYIGLVKRCQGGEVVPHDVDDDDVQILGSSHGWIASFNRQNHDLILSNPLSGRHVKLPPIDTLPIPESNLKGGFDCVSKLILSCSPVEESRHEKCRAMMTFGPMDLLAFCLPGSSKEWTHIGKPRLENGRWELIPRSYECLVFSSKYGLFFCVCGNGDLEAWDLREPESPGLILMNVKCPLTTCSEDVNVKKLSFLVVDPFSGDLYLVNRRVIAEQQHDLCGYEGCLYRTCGFDVFKFYGNESVFKHMDRSLDGLAMFIGKNHSFALRASDFHGLKPNSIYFAGVDEASNLSDQPFEQEIGMFDYENGDFSPWYTPSIKSRFGCAMWHTPTSV